MQRKSLGFIETWGHVPAVEAADAGCKAANVVLAGYEEVRAGLVTITFSGEIAAVQAAVTSGTAAAQRVGKVVCSHVIARPDRQLQVFFSPPPDSGPSPAPPPPPPSAPSPPPEKVPQDLSTVGKETEEPPAASAPAAEKAVSRKASKSAVSKKPGMPRRRKKA